MLHEFASLAFEDVCRAFVRELQRDQALPFRYSRMGRWMGKTTVRNSSAPTGISISETEIDILAVSRGAKEYLVGECKFKNHPFAFSEYLDTAAKLAPLKENARFTYALFSESGFDEKLTAEAKEGDLLLFPLETIVNYKNP